MSGETELARVTITRSLDPRADLEDSDIIRTEYSEGLTLIDALGMMTFALLNAGEDYRQNAEEAEGDG